MKDKQNVKDKKNVVYQIKCSDCPAKYIGETGRQTKQRLKEHERDIRTRKPENKIYQHVGETGH